MRANGRRANMRDLYTKFRWVRRESHADRPLRRVSDKVPHRQVGASLPRGAVPPGGTSHLPTRMAISCDQTRQLSFRPSERKDQVNAALIAHSGEGNLPSIRRPGRKPIRSGVSGKAQDFLISHNFDVYILVELFVPLQTNATCLPSGENAGIISKPDSVVGNYPRRR